MGRREEGWCRKRMRETRRSILFTGVVLVGSLMVSLASATASETLVCKVTLNEIEFDGNDNPSASPDGETDYFCDCNPVQMDGRVSELMYQLDLPDDVLDPMLPRLKQGEDIFVSIAGGTLETDYSVAIPEGSVVKEVDPPDSVGQHRRLARPPLEGDVTAIILRVIANGVGPDASANEIDKLIFKDDISLKNQLEECSMGKFRLHPTEYGVLDVHVDISAEQSNFRALINAAYKQALLLVEPGTTDIRSLTNFVMIALPPGTGSWGAFAAIPGQQSVFNNNWITYLGAQAHEVGHNLGLRHAFHDGIEYGGTTGYMGSAPKTTNYPRKCYNGQNSWHLGWYVDRTLEISPQQTQVYHVAAFVDYRKTNEEEYVVLKISEAEIYLQNNRAKAFNRESGEFRDTLTIVKNDNKGTHLLGGLNSSFPLYQEQIGSDTLTIEICEEIRGSLSKPHVLAVNVGYGESKCQEYLEASAAMSFTKAPSSSPPSDGQSLGSSPDDNDSNKGKKNRSRLRGKRSMSSSLAMIIPAAVASVFFAGMFAFFFMRARKKGRSKTDVMPGQNRDHGRGPLDLVDEDDSIVEKPAKSATSIVIPGIEFDSNPVKESRCQQLSGSSLCCSDATGADSWTWSSIWE